MSLAALIRAESTSKTKCKTCDLLRLMTDDDRAEFEQAAKEGVAGSVLARAVTARLRELGEQSSVGEGSIRYHVGGHGA